MSKIGIIIVCGVAGVLIGLLMAGGAINQTKKSQRESFSPIAIIAGLAIGVVSGIVISNKIIQDDNLTKKYGLDNLETFEGKMGRKWVIESRWKNPLTGNANKIETRFSESHGSVITFLNDEPQIDHQSTSGAKSFIQKAHINFRYELIKKIKTGELELV